MQLAWKEGNYLVMGLMAEDDEERAILEGLRDRADEVRIENRSSMFRDLEIVIYLPTRQPPERVMDTKASAIPISNLPEPELIPSAERKAWARLIKEEEQRSD